MAHVSVCGALHVGKPRNPKADRVIKPCMIEAKRKLPVQGLGV